MRSGVLAVGLVLAIIGAVVLEYPLFPQSVCSGSVGDNYLPNFPAGGPPPIECQVKTELMPIQLVVSWTSNGTGTFFLYLCTTNETFTSGQPVLPPDCTFTASQTGTSGASGTFSASSGEYLLLYFTSTHGSSAQATTKSTQPLVGLPLLVLGVIVVLAGIAMRKTAAQTPTAPTSNPPSK